MTLAYNAVGPGLPTAGACVGSKTVDQLLKHATSIYRRLSLQDLLLLRDPSSVARDDPGARRAWSLFSTWNLFVNAAIADHNISTYVRSSSVPPPIDGWSKAEPTDLANPLSWRGYALDAAWRGESLRTHDSGEPRENVIGALAFLFFFLFLFEGYCKITLDRVGDVKVGGRDPSLRRLVDEFLSAKFPDADLDSVRYVVEYRNSWHTFGRFGQSKSPMNHASLPPLVPGEPLPVLSEQEGLSLVSAVVELLIRMDEEYFGR